jgi:hypothetical protein
LFDFFSWLLENRRYSSVLSVSAGDLGYYLKLNCLLIEDVFCGVVALLIKFVLNYRLLGLVVVL